jgi:hypothetical protein
MKDVKEGSILGWKGGRNGWLEGLKQGRTEGWVERLEKGRDKGRGERT